jgi:hypothetical protein
MTEANDRLVEEYLDQVGRAAAGLPPQRRDELVADLREHIAAARGALSPETEAGVRTILARLGEPADIAAEARRGEPPAAPPPPPPPLPPPPLPPQPSPVLVPRRSRNGLWIALAVTIAVVSLVCACGAGGLFAFRSGSVAPGSPASPVPAPTPSPSST